MSNISIFGNLTKDPELRYTAKGVPVANITVAVGNRKYNRDTQTWEDANTVFWNCNVFHAMAENVTETLRKGDSVIVHGTVQQRTFEAKDGTSRTVYEIVADAVGPNLKNATATITKIKHTDKPTITQDPWAQPVSSEPPF